MHYGTGVKEKGNSKQPMDKIKPRDWRTKRKRKGKQKLCIIIVYVMRYNESFISIFNKTNFSDYIYFILCLINFFMPMILNLFKFNKYYVKFICLFIYLKKCIRIIS